MAPTPTEAAPLTVEDLHVYYGVSHVLQGIDVDVSPGEVMALVGRNGVGKTTLVNAIMGILPASRGLVRLMGTDVTRLASHERWRRGLVLVPQGRRVFGSLTVHEHLTVQPSPRVGDYDEDRIYELFPLLGHRRNALATTLSGGERSMLAIARALVGNPGVLLMDEPTEGLAPKLVQQVAELTTQLACQGLPVLLVEQNLKFTLAVAGRIGIMDRGVVRELYARDDIGDLDEFAQRTLADPDFGIGSAEDGQG